MLLKEHPTDLEVGESGWNSRAAYRRAYLRQQSELSARSNLESKVTEFRAQGGEDRSGSRFNPPHLQGDYPHPPLGPKTAEELKELIIRRRQSGLDIRPQMIEYGRLVGITTQDRAAELSAIVTGWFK